MPSTASQALQELREARLDLRQQIAAVRVDVLAEKRDLTHAVGGECRDLGDDLARARLDCSRPRTAGTMQ